ncbi:putative MFS family arabinose efflux permease [Maritalea mobilis]|uniref:Putative MFS family arabinose efflux permease n=1 Tax=Maritalea mobilis TaxID=483324 RepID=A0A4R6VQI3_9HYPH|nr:MFS transporter [Maritalea mobilis]TDQ64476.1 putative MFS family arabinose efflux permease [Maritalea mobilis]
MIFKKYFVALENLDFRLLVVANLISGAGVSLVPIAFAIETIKVEPRGWGMACVLITLWVGRFLGMLIYKKVGFNFHPVLTMVGSISAMCIAQAGLLLWVLSLPNSILAMSISSVLYGFASAFFIPSVFVYIPVIVADSMRAQANSLLSIVSNIYQLIGPLLGASLAVLLGFHSVLFFSAAMFCISMLLLRKLYFSHKIANGIWKNKISGQEKDLHTDVKQRLPIWTYLGLVSWFFCSLAIGTIAAAGPTLIIASHSALEWAIVATAMATGSLFGSTISLTGVARNFPWHIVHVLCGLGLGVQLFVLSWSFAIWGVCVASFVGAASVSTSGIRWDTMGQRLFSGKRLHSFASLDQFASSAGIPAGMVLFGLSGLIGDTTSIIVAVGGLAFLSTLPVLASFVKKRKQLAR